MQMALNPTFPSQWPVTDCHIPVYRVPHPAVTGLTAAVETRSTCGRPIGNRSGAGGSPAYHWLAQRVTAVMGDVTGQCPPSVTVSAALRSSGLLLANDNANINTINNTAGTYLMLVLCIFDTYSVAHTCRP